MSDTEEKNNGMPETQQTQWGPIIFDMIILMAVMGALGFLCNLIMMPFEKTYPTDTLISIILKAKMENGMDPVFDKELAKGMQSGGATFINTGDLTGRTPLMWTVYANFNDPKKAADKDDERLFYLDALLKTPGIAPGQTDKDGFNALHWAAWSGMPKCCAKLIETGVDVNAKDNSGYTPLMLAALRGNVEVVRLLLKNDADAALVNAEGRTAKELATSFESAYNQRSSFAYKLIYSKNRETYYRATLALLNGEDLPTVELSDDDDSDDERQSVKEREVEVQEGAGEPTTINPTEDTPATAE